MNVDVFNILQKVYGARGLPFPQPPNKGNGTAIATTGHVTPHDINNVSTTGSLIRKYDDDLLGSYQFLPAYIEWTNEKTKITTKTDLPNAVVMISGEKSIEETDIVGVGTVFEKVFTRPYSITIICTLIGENGNWPESKIKELCAMWEQDMVVTLKCALTNLFIDKGNNFIIQKMEIMDNQGSENVEVIQFTGMSNIYFELELL
jgi:hypothetical protein